MLNNANTNKANGNTGSTEGGGVSAGEGGGGAYSFAASFHYLAVYHGTFFEKEHYCISYSWYWGYLQPVGALSTFFFSIYEVFYTRTLFESSYSLPASPFCGHHLYVDLLG